MRNNPKTLYLHKPFMGQLKLREEESFRPINKVVKIEEHWWGKSTKTEVFEEDPNHEYIVKTIASMPSAYKVTMTCYWTQHDEFVDRTYGKEVELFVPFEDAYYTEETPFHYDDSNKKVMDGRGFGDGWNPNP